MRKVVTEISSLLHRSNGHWRRRSFAASVPSDVSKLQKGRRRVSKDERKAMVGSFVNKYRATKEGKFPTASEAIKQVGGSYYFVKKILQELEYQSKISSLPTRNDMKLGKVVVKVNETSKQAEEVSGTRLKNAAINKDVKTVAGYDVDIGDSGLKIVRTEDEPEEFVKHKTTDESVGEDEGDVHHCPEKPEPGVKERSHSDGVLDLDGPKTKSEQHQQSSESEKFASALSEMQHDDQELSKKSSMWGNLKTFADGIIKMWKKR